jgi:AraC family transcriptional regulator
MLDVTTARPELAYGTFFGQEKRKVSLGGFCLSILQPEAWGDELPEHSHSEAHLIFPLRGRYVSTAVGYANGDSVRPVIYNPPAVVHRDRFASSQGLFLGISIARDRFSQMHLCGLPDYPVALRSPRISQRLAALRSEIQIEDPSSAMIIEGLCLEILGYIGRATTTRNVARPSWINTAIQVLLDNLDRRLTAEELAAVLAISESELLRGFMRTMGCSPGVFVRSQRMERARQLLLSSTFSLAEVALAVGFSDQSAFTKAFTRMHGCSPGAFRGYQ